MPLLTSALPFCGTLPRRQSTSSLICSQTATIPHYINTLNHDLRLVQKQYLLNGNRSYAT